MSITVPRVPCRSTALLVALGVAALTACAAPPPVPPPATQPLAVWDVRHGWVDVPVTAAVAPVQRWRIAVAPEALLARDPAGTVLVIGEPTSDGARVQRLDPGTGAPVWAADLTGGSLLDVELVGSPPVAVAGVLDGGSRVLLLAPDSGAVLADSTAPEGSYFVSGTADVVLLDALDGTTALGPAGEVRWSVPEQVTVADGELLAAGTGFDGPGTIAVLDPATGQPRWTVPRPGFSDTTVVAGRVIATSAAALPGEVAEALGLEAPPPTGSGDTALALDAATGAPLWATQGLPSLGAGGVVGLAEDTVLLPPGEPGAPAVALDAATGAVRWIAPEGPSLPVRVAGTTYVLDAFPGVAVYDAGDGRELARIPGEIGTRAGFAGSVVLFSAGDELVAYGLPDLVERWRIVVGPLYDLAPLPGGMVVQTSDALVAFTDGPQ